MNMIRLLIAAVFSLAPLLEAQEKLPAALFGRVRLHNNVLLRINFDGIKNSERDKFFMRRATRLINF